MKKNYFHFLLFTLFFSAGLFNTAQAQSIVSVTPDSAMQGQTLSVVITGSATSFGQGTATTQAWLSQGMDIIAPNSVVELNSTQLLVNFTIPVTSSTGLYDLNTYNGTDGLLTLANGFKINTIATGISGDLKNEVSGLAYPNPFANELKLRYTLSKQALVQVSLYDISGRQLFVSGAEQVSPGEQLYEIGSEYLDLPSGIYFVRLSADGQDYNYKVVKRN
ncbi:MAG TPA: T9SS type A sorting domain-containing protein [Bacteroidia bacterium]|jgi:hypothetical protein